MRRKQGRSGLKAMLVGMLGVLALGAPIGVTASAQPPPDEYLQRVEELARELSALGPLEAGKDVAPGVRGGEEAGKLANQSGEEAAQSQSEGAAANSELSAHSMLQRSARTTAQGRIFGPRTEPFSLGGGYSWEFQIGNDQYHWLGAFDVSNIAQWCIDFASSFPTGEASPLSVQPQTVPDVVANSSDFQVHDNQQAAFILNKYGNNEDPGIRAATSVLVHLNYETGDGRRHLDALLNSLTDPQVSGPAGPIIADMARTMTGDAYNNAPVFVAGDAVLVPSESRQTFELQRLGVVNQTTGEWVSGVEVSVSLSGGAGVFDQKKITDGSVSADELTWKGVTKSEPMVLSGHSVESGQLRAVIEFGAIDESNGLSAFERPNGTQSTVQYTPGTVVVTGPVPPPIELIHSFQPKLESNTGTAGSRILDSGTSTLRDHLTVFADPAVAGGNWLGVGGRDPASNGYQPLPVKFTGTAFRVGVQPAAESQEIPADAEVVATTSIVADGPGEYEVEVAANMEPGFITWVWNMDVADQKQLSDADRKLLAADWSDNYGVASEQTSVRWPGKIESNLTVKPTIDNVYLVDDVWVSGLPEDHAGFMGAQGFGSDLGTISQELYFWEEGVEVADLKDAVKVGETTSIPASNGVYLGQGDLSWKLLRDADGKPVPGTYQMVHTFAGDDRVEPFQTVIPDVTEQFTVSTDPQIGTTATGPGNNKVIAATKEVTITDNACYLGLRPGKEYTLQGKLMDKSTQEPLLVDGREVTSIRMFTPDSEDGCVDLDFIFDGSVLAGKSVVVFEDLWSDSKVVATHADIDDRGQTVSFEPPTVPDVPLAKTGLSSLLPLLGGAAAAALGGTIVLVNRRKKS